LESSSGDAPAAVNKLLYGVRDVLRQDVDDCWDRLENEDSPFWRRAFVRAVFAFFEGMIATLKLEAILTHKLLQQSLSEEPLKTVEGKSVWESLDEHLEKARRGANFSPAEMLCLGELAFDLTDNGEIKWKKAKIPLEKDLSFAFRIYAKSFRVEFKLDKGGRGWQKFRTATRIRDRLTHPRRLEDLAVSDEKLQTVEDAVLWIHQQLSAVQEVIMESQQPKKIAS